MKWFLFRLESNKTICDRQILGNKKYLALLGFSLSINSYQFCYTINGLDIFTFEAVEYKTAVNSGDLFSAIWLLDNDEEVGGLLKFVRRCLQKKDAFEINDWTASGGLELRLGHCLN